MESLLLEHNVQQCREQISDWRTPECEIDGSRRLVRNIALTGLKSRNGYRYTEQALRGAVPLYQNKPVFLDHAANIARPYDRSARDLVGSIVNPRYEGHRIRADIQVLDTEAGRTFLALADAQSPAVGMSHVVLAQRSSDRSVVERIQEVVSVDAVAFPATTTTFRERIEGTPSFVGPGSIEEFLFHLDQRLAEHFPTVQEGDWTDIARIGLYRREIVVQASEKTTKNAQHFLLEWGHDTQDNLTFADSVRQIDPASILDELSDPEPFSNRLLRANSTSKGGEADTLETLRQELRQMTGERDSLRRQLQEQHCSQAARRNAEEIDRLLAEAHLPEFAITDLLRSQLETTTDPAARRRLIDERKTLLEHAARPEPYSYPRLHQTDQSVNDNLFIDAIKQNRRSVLSSRVS